MTVINPITSIHLNPVQILQLCLPILVSIITNYLVSLVFMSVYHQGRLDAAEKCQSPTEEILL